MPMIEVSLALGRSPEQRVVTCDDGRRFVVFDVDGDYRVTDAVCPHNRGPLEQGWLRDG